MGSNPSELCQSIAMRDSATLMAYSPVNEKIVPEAVPRSLVPNVVAKNRREFLKFEAMYQVKQEQPKLMSRKQRKKQLIDVY